MQLLMANDQQLRPSQTRMALRLAKRRSLFFLFDFIKTAKESGLKSCELNLGDLQEYQQ
jgi:hypothetical protein